MRENVYLSEVIKLIKKRIWIVILITVVATASSAVASYLFIPKEHKVTTQIIVTGPHEDKEDLNLDSIQTNLSLVNSYQVMLNSPKVLNQVIENLHLDRTMKELQSQTIIQSEHDSQVIDILVTDKDKEKAIDIADTLVLVFQDEVKNTLKVDNVKTFTEATEIESGISPVIMNVLIAFVLSAVVGIGLILFIEHLNRPVRNEHDVKEWLDLPVLGTVSKISSDQTKTIKNE